MKLSKLNKPLEITFKEMLNLMNQCDIVEKQSSHKIQTRSNDNDNDDNIDDTFMNRQFPNNPFSLLSGIIPGMTKGNMARLYIDWKNSIRYFPI